MLEQSEKSIWKQQSLQFTCYWPVYCDNVIRTHYSPFPFRFLYRLLIGSILMSHTREILFLIKKKLTWVNKQARLFTFVLSKTNTKWLLNLEANTILQTKLTQIRFDERKIINIKMQIKLEHCEGCAYLYWKWWFG